MVTWTLSNPTLLYCPMLWAVTNRPMVALVFMVTVVEPIFVQVVPSVEYHEVNVLPDRCSLSHWLGDWKLARAVAEVTDLSPIVVPVGPITVYCMWMPCPTIGVMGGSGLAQPLTVQLTPLIFGVLGLTVGATSKSTSGAPAVGDCAINSPALAHGLEFVW